MNTTDIGNRGETIASIYLQKNGYTVITRNWKHRLCEIDIIASKQKCIYFVEVKYRKNDIYGGGFDYITAKKQKQMQFAATMWSTVNKYHGDMQLAALAVTGNNGEVEFIDCL